MIALLSHIKTIGIVVVIVALIALGWYAYNSIYDKGYNACQALHDKAIQALQEQSRQEIAKITEDFDNAKEELLQKGDTGYGVGGRVGDALDLLRERNGG